MRPNPFERAVYNAGSVALLFLSGLCFALALAFPLPASRWFHLVGCGLGLGVAVPGLWAALWALSRKE